jgi:acetyltransferase
MPVTKQRVGVGLICQSGIHFVGPTKFSGMIGKGVDLGNSCDIGFYDALKYFAEDPAIQIIAIHMEGLNQGKDFLPLAARVVKEKPIVVHKSGRSETGAKAAMSHTGSLAGNYDAWRTQSLYSGLEGGFERSPCGWNYLCCHCPVARVFLSECLRGSERRG